MSQEYRLVKQQVNLAKGAKLLVCSTDNLGDLVFTSGIFFALKQMRPDVHVSVWCKNYTSEIAELLPGRPKIFASDPFWDHSPLRSRGSWRGVLKTLGQIRREKFDLAIVASHCWQMAVMTRFSGIPHRVGFLHKSSHWGLNLGLPVMDGNLPVVSELLRVLQPLGFDQGQVDARYRLEKKPLEKYAEKLLNLPEGKFICLHPFAGSPKRCAEISMWGQFAQYLKNKGESIIWVGAPNELRRLEVLGESAPKAVERSDFYVGESIQAMSALLARAKAYVGHDSGPLHIAAGLQVPVLGLFLAGLSPRTLPQGLGLAETIRLNSPKELSLHAWCEAWAALDQQLPSIV